MTSTRRQLLGRGIGVAGAATVPTSLLTATPAFAQEDEETDALERLVELEQASELAYALAVEEGGLDSDVERAFDLYGGHNGEHDTALSEALDQLGVDPSEAASDPADYEALADFDAGAQQKEVLEFMIGLEEDLVAAYEEETVNLEAEDLVRSAAQIGACHAQQLVALRLLAGERPGHLTFL